MKGQKPPAPSTLAKYGLTLDRWRAFFRACKGLCPVCGRNVILVIDHEHAVGWKRMGPEERVQYVRGLLCHMCNHYILTRYGNPERFEAAAVYLRAYDERRGQWLSK